MNCQYCGRPVGRATDLHESCYNQAHPFKCMACRGYRTELGCTCKDSEATQITLEVQSDLRAEINALKSKLEALGEEMNTIKNNVNRIVDVLDTITQRLASFDSTLNAQNSA